MVLATVPFTAGHPDGQLIFEVAFVVVVLSVALQAPTVGPLARRLGVLAVEKTTVRPEIIAVDALDADLVEITVPDGSRMQGVSLGSSAPPGGARVAVIRRGEETVVPDGDTELETGDVLLVIAPLRCDLDALEAWSHAAPIEESKES